MYYCKQDWGITSDAYFASLIVLQQRAVRLVTVAGRGAQTEPLLPKFDLLSLTKLYNYSIAMFVNTWYYGMCPFRSVQFSTNFVMYMNIN